MGSVAMHRFVNVIATTHSQRKPTCFHFGKDIGQFRSDVLGSVSLILFFILSNLTVTKKTHAADYASTAHTAST